MLDRILRERGIVERPRRMEVSASSGWSYDTVWVGGKPLTPPARTSNYLKIYLDGTTTPEWVAAMPAEQSEDYEVFDVTKLQIHLPGNFA